MWIDFSKSIEKRIRFRIFDEHQVMTLNTSLNAHTLVRGVAGSGKSILLAERILRILNETDYQNILVLTYNRFMNGWLKSLIPISNRSIITCRTFHSWAFKFLYFSVHDPLENFINKATDVAKTTGLKYDAILIDEGQDFKDEWLVGTLLFLNPSTNSLFLVYDNAQSVYGNPHRRKAEWTWKKIGINIIGRTDILRFSYRNTPEILNLAWTFIKPYIERANIPIDDSGAGAILEPKFIPNRSSKILPIIQQCINFDQIAHEVKSALSSCPNSSIAIMHPPDLKRQFQAQISESLNKLNIPHIAPVKSYQRDKNIVFRPCVIVDSWNALKGVEFDAVILVGIDLALPENVHGDDEFDKIAGLYAAMTRGRDHLVMLYSNRTKIVSQIEVAMTVSTISLNSSLFNFSPQ